MNSVWDVYRRARSYYTPHEEKLAAIQELADIGTSEALECLYNIASDGYMDLPYVNAARDQIKELEKKE